MNLSSTSLRSFLISSAIALTAAAQQPEQSKKAPAKEAPLTWEMALAEEAQPLWDRFRADGKVTVAEIIAANREYGEARNGEAQAATAWLLIGLQDEDPIPVLREMMKHPDAEVCAFAITTAGPLADIRLEADLDALAADKRGIGMKKESRFAKGTIAGLVDDAMHWIAKGGVLAGDREEGVEVDMPTWLTMSPPGSPELAEAVVQADRSLEKAMVKARDEHRKVLAQALSAATEVEILLLDGITEKVDAAPMYWQNRQPRDRFPVVPYGSTTGIAKRRYLTAEEVKLLMPSLKDTIRAENQQGGALCHFPVHGVRIYNGVDGNGDRNIVFQTSICYACGNFYLSDEEGQGGWLGLTPGEFQQVMEKLMPIPQHRKDAVLKPDGK